MSELKPKTLMINNVPYFLTKNSKLIKVPANALNTSFSRQIIDKTTGSVKKIKIVSLINEQVLYETEDPYHPYLINKYVKMTLKNRWHKVKNSSVTIATFTKSDGSKIVKTSTNVTKLIGQQNYDSVFTALCSILSQGLKIEGMLALLAQEKKTSEKSCQTDSSSNFVISHTLGKTKRYVETSSQTDEINSEMFHRKRPRIKRKHLTPCVVKGESVATPKIKKIIIDPNSIEDCMKLNVIADNEIKKIIIDPNSIEDCMKLNVTADNDKHRELFPDLKNDLDGLSQDNDGNCSTSGLSVSSDIVNPASLNEMFDQVTDFTLKNEFSNMLENGKFDLPTATDQFHIATPAILKKLPLNERRKLVIEQLLKNLKLCTEMDEDGFMPLHIAVLHNDLDLIWNQGHALKIRQRSVDIPTSKGMTALKLSIQHNSHPACTNMLLALGADPLLVDDELQTSFHQAAEMDTGHLQAIMQSVSQRAREIVAANRDLQYPDIEMKPLEEIARHLFLQISIMGDSSGYTPLMLASKLGMHENVKLLVNSAPETVNTGMSNFGDTALYLAVAEACMIANETNNKTHISENYLKTIETLIDFGADPELGNLSGNKISDLLQEFNNNFLLTLVANRVTSRNFDIPLPSSTKPDSYMLYKDEKGKIDLMTNVKVDKPKSKLKILQNVTINRAKAFDPKKQNVKEVLKDEIPKNVVVYNPSTIEDVPANIIIKKMADTSFVTVVSAWGSDKTESVIKVAPKSEATVKKEVSKLKAKDNNVIKKE